MMYISATDALYSKMYSFGMTLVISSFRYMLIQTVTKKLLASLMSNYFSETPVVCTTSYFVKII